MNRTAVAKISLCACCIVCTARMSSVAAPSAYRPLTVEQFLASEGVNTHINYTDGAYGDVQKVVDALRYLGMTNVRDSLNAPGQSGAPSVDAYKAIALGGIRFTFMVGGGGPIDGSQGTLANPSLDQRIGYIDDVAASVPGSVAAVEGTNEINNQPIVYNGIGSAGGADELQAALLMQHDLYARVKGAPHLHDVPVYYFTGYGVGPIAAGPDPTAAAGLADYDNQHPYPQHGQPPANWVSRRQALNNKLAQDVAASPAVYTETGYSSGGGTDGGVDSDTQMKYSLDLLLDTASLNITATFLYELLDAYPAESPQGQHGAAAPRFGLFDQQGQPKPVAVAIHTLNAILRHALNTPRGRPAPPAPYSIASRAPGSRSLAMTMPGGQVVVLWDEQPIWDGHRGVPIKPASYSVKLRFAPGAGCDDIALFDPTVGMEPLVVRKASCTLDIPLSDHPVIVLLHSR